ncbi:hypothetical protein BG841_10360 [Marinobacter sp. X15-166B]|nr:hypothetical protein BG841_10360 [Marinobacter sp. X15-166B]
MHPDAEVTARVRELRDTESLGCVVPPARTFKSASGKVVHRYQLADIPSWMREALERERKDQGTMA